MEHEEREPCLEEGQSEEDYRKPRRRARKTKRMAMSAWHWCQDQCISIKGCVGLIFFALTIVILVLLTTHPFFEIFKNSAKAYLTSDESRNEYVGFRPPTNWTCERISLPKSAAWFWENYVLPRKPVVILGALEQMRWQTNKWTVDYLDEKVGDVQVRFEQKQSSDPRFGQVGEKRESFRWFLRNVFAGDTNPNRDPTAGKTSDYYFNLQDPIPGTIMQHPLQDLTNDFTIPHFFTTTQVNNINLWLGNADNVVGGRSALHHDGGDNVYALVEGQKLAHLWAPSDGYNLYTMGRIQHIAPNGHITYVPGSSLREPHFSNLRDPDDGFNEKEFPKFRQTTRGECMFGKGDMLFLPSGWFHELHSFGRTLAINFWADEPEDFEVLRWVEEQEKRQKD